MREKIFEENREKLLLIQKRCVECGANNHLEVHHRIFRSQGPTIKSFLEKVLPEYNKKTGKDIKVWGLHSVENLVVLCSKCHVSLHNRSGEDLAEKYKNSFTCKKTGFNISFYIEDVLY